MEAKQMQMFGKVNKVMSIYQVAVKARDSNQNQYRNIHYFEFFGSVPTDATLQELVDGLDSEYKTLLQGFIGDSFTFYAYDVRRVDLGDLPTAEVVATAGEWDGTATADVLPHQTAPLVTFKAPTTFPRSSRSYLFGFTEAANTAAGRVSTTAIAALLAWGQNILTIDVTAGIDPDKSTVQFGGTPRAVTASNDLQTVTVGNNWATQRRRRSGVGI